MRFDMICEASEIEHRPAKPNHPWTNGQVERLNRTTKEGEARSRSGDRRRPTVERFPSDSHDQLRPHLADFPAACNLARRPKKLNGLTPCDYIRKIRTSEPDRFIPEPDPPDAGTEQLGLDCPRNRGNSSAGYRRNR